MFNLNKIVFMKIGSHGNESIDSIIARKQLEYDSTNSIFWGYGGSVCHPVNQVQQFISENKEVYLLMQKIDSNFSIGHEVKTASEYSVDKVVWNFISPGINVTNSKYAFV